MIYYIGLGINFFLLLLLVAKRGKNLADNILAAWLFVIGLHTISFVLTLQPVTIDNVHLIFGVSAPFPLIHGPFLYLYTAASTNMFPKKKLNWLTHFVPFIATCLVLLPLYLKTGEQKLHIYNYDGSQYQFSNYLLNVLIKVSGMLYIVWSFILLRKHKKNIGDQFSYEEKINLNWLRYLIYGLLVIWLIIIVFKKSTLIFTGGVVFVTLLGFLGIQQVGIFGKSQILNSDPTSTAFEEHDFEAAIEPKENHTKKKYANSGLSPEAAIELHEKLKLAMEEQKWFTEPELSLTLLADKLKIHPNYLSQVINEKEGKSFFDYVNSLRVEEFKKLAAEPSNSRFTMLSLSYDCGFNSKSSFNKNFKKVTGVSPSEYLAGLSKNTE